MLDVQKGAPVTEEDARDVPLCAHKCYFTVSLSSFQNLSKNAFQARDVSVTNQDAFQVSEYFGEWYKNALKVTERTIKQNGLMRNFFIDQKGI